MSNVIKGSGKMRQLSVTPPLFKVLDENGEVMDSRYGRYSVYNVDTGDEFEYSDDPDSAYQELMRDMFTKGGSYEFRFKPYKVQVTATPDPGKEDVPEEVDKAA